MKKPRIFYVIHPTKYNDYDILAIGDKKMLRKLSKEYDYFHYIASIPIVILDTCDTIKCALECVEHLKGVR